MAIPDWLSIIEISRRWGEETGLDPSSFQKDLEEWFTEFVKEPPTSRQLMPGVTFDTIMVNRLLGMLGARYLERKTFEAYCEECGHSKPIFWFAGWDAERNPVGPSLERPQHELMQSAIAVSAEVAELKARQKRRRRAIFVAGLAVPLAALLLWGTQTVIQLAAVQREIAGLDAAVEASDSLIAKLRDELVIVRQAVESACKRNATESSVGTHEQLDASLVSAVDAKKSEARAQADTLRLRSENTRLTDELTGTKSIADEAKVVGSREEFAAGQQEAKVTQPLTGSGAKVPSDPSPLADQQDSDQSQAAQDVKAAPEIEEVLTAVETLSDPVTSKTDSIRDTVSPVDLLPEPGHHVGREVVVTGSVVWLLRRYWLQLDSGHMSILINVEDLQLDDRNKLKDAVVQIEFLARVRARITGTIERQGSENYHLAATELVLVE